MTAPRAREQADPPSSPDRRPPRRGGSSSPRTYAASTASRRVPPVARHGLVRSARAPSAEAETATTLVSNTGQSTTRVESSYRAVSQRFTTGSNEDGYTLTGVDVVSASSTGFTAQVCGVDSDTLKPTSPCTNLTAPGTFAVGTMSFTAPADIPLTNSTTYAVVVTALATNTPAPGETWTGVAQGWGAAATNGEDADPAAGWSLSDSVHIVERRETLGSWSRTGVELRIAIKGYAGGGTLSTDATLSGLSLGTGVTLSPTFASGTATYTASVANSVDEVTVTATENHASADFEIQDADGNALADADTNAAGHQVALVEGENVIKVKVTAGDGTATQTYTVTGRDFVTGTSFELTGGSPEAGGYAALWGRGAISRFDGREGDLTLDGEVTTGLIGADWAAAPDSGSGAGRWTAGLAVGHARGTGSYSEGGNCTGNDGNDGNDGDGSDGHGSNPGASGCSGEVESTLTGLWPYAGFRLTDRISAWAAAGYGTGELRLTPGGETDGPFTAVLTMTMGAAGLRGEVLAPPPEGGLALAVKGDTRFTRTQSKATRDANGGRLEAATGDVWLLRLGVEGSRRFALGADDAGATLTPRFEVGARLDGGDAETGAGADVGAGVALAAPKHGLMLVLNARGLLAHEASGFRESGASASLTWDPRPTTDRGLMLTLRQSWGGSPAGGMDALLGRGTVAGLAADDNGATAGAGRLEAELGYGIPAFGGALTATPHLRFGLTDTGRDYHLGWRLKSARKGTPGFELGLEATRREAANADAEHALMLRGAIRW